MCGRFASTQTDADLVRAFRVEEVVGEQLAPSYNVAPTQPVRAVLERTPREEPEAPPIRQIRTVRWGLIPSWGEGSESRIQADQRPRRASAGILAFVLYEDQHRRDPVARNQRYQWTARNGDIDSLGTCRKQRDARGRHSWHGTPELAPNCRDVRCIPSICVHITAGG